jgi:hypothetical protein
LKHPVERTTVIQDTGFCEMVPRRPLDSQGKWAVIHWLTDAAAVINSRLFRLRFMPLCFPCVLGAARLLPRFCGDVEARRLASQMPQAH